MKIKTISLAVIIGILFAGSVTYAAIYNPIETPILNGFTKLGSEAPSIKMKKLTGTTDADSETSVAHGLTLSKILSVNIIVVGSTISVAPNYLSSADTNYYAYQMDATNIVMTSVQAGVRSGNYTILITYEE